MSTPPDPREERFRPMARFLSWAVYAIAALAVLAVVLTGTPAETAATGVLVLLVAAPLVRVAWLVLRWFRRGDNRYAMVGVVVLLIPVVGFLLAH